MTADSNDQGSLPVSIRGGAGGSVAMTEDLHQAATALEQAEREVTAAEWELRMAEYQADRAVDDAIEGVRGLVIDAKHAVYDARWAVGGTQLLIADVQETSDALHRAAREYEEAEEQARHGVSMWSRMGQAWADTFGVATWLGRHHLANIWALTPPGLVRIATGTNWVGESIRPDGLPRLTGLIHSGSVGAWLGLLDTDLPSGNGYQAASTLLSRASARLEDLAMEPPYIGSQARVGVSTRRQPQGLADLIQGIADVPFGDHGAIAIDTITHADGTQAHIVSIPGTADVSANNPSPFDMATNFQANSGQDSDMTRFIRDAMEDAGIKSGEPVMLVGHSQGGVVAAQAVNSDLLSDYSISHVVSAGSPVGRNEVDPDVEYAHLEAIPDVVHALDGRTNPDLPNVMTVSADPRSADNPDLRAAGSAFIPTHSLGMYAAVGLAADTAVSASAIAWHKSASAFLGEGTSKRHEYQPVVGVAPCVR